MLFKFQYLDKITKGFSFKKNLVSKDLTFDESYWNKI